MRIRVRHDFPLSGIGLPGPHAIVGPSERRVRERAEDIPKVARELKYWPEVRIRVRHDFPFSGIGLPGPHAVVGPSERRERERAEDIPKVA